MGFAGTVACPAHLRSHRTIAGNLMRVLIRILICVLLIITPGLIMVHGLCVAVDSPEAQNARFDFMLRYAGYQGCKCPDCAQHYLGVTRYTSPCRAAGQPRLAGGAGEMAWSACALGVGLIVVCNFDQRSASRRACGQCVHCAYSLAGLPTGTRCPECGRAP